VPSSAIERYVANATGSVGICQLPSASVGTVASVSQGVAPPARRRWIVTWWTPPGRTWPQATLSRKSTQIGSEKFARCSVRRSRSRNTVLSSVEAAEKSSPGETGDPAVDFARASPSKRLTSSVRSSAWYQLATSLQ